jgi:hypothetical protein
MKILTIGNSFSDDATRYLHQIAKSQGVYLEVVNICIGGCSLERHYRNMLGDKKDYLLCYNGTFTGFYTTLEEALLSRKWDVVTIQQVSHESPKKESFYPYINELADYIRTCQPQAKLLLQETWAYEDGSHRLTVELGYESRKAMLSDVQAAYKEAAEIVGVDGIIPSGTLFDMMLDRGVEKVHRDTFHASLGLGRYALGLLWFRTLTGKSVAENCFRELDVAATDKEIEITKACVDTFEPIL